MRCASASVETVRKHHPTFRFVPSSAVRECPCFCVADAEVEQRELRRIEEMRALQSENQMLNALLRKLKAINQWKISKEVGVRMRLVRVVLTSSVSDHVVRL